MKKRLCLSCVIIALMITSKVTPQGFVKEIEGDDLGVLYGNQCIARLESGEEIQGKFAGAVMINGGITKISIKLENGEKAKFKPEEVVSFLIKASGFAKLAMMAESGSSIQELTHSDFGEIVNRDYIIFETARTAKKTDTYRLLQLLNPGFDSKIKVFATETGKTGGTSIGGIKLTGGMDKAYLFVKGDEKAVMVKKSSYRKNFEELYSDCPEMLSVFEGDRIKWNDVAGHVFVYDQVCK